MNFFTESPHCRSRAHCGTCRDRAGGRAWRKSLATAFALPAGAPDFECPRGLPWGAKPEPAALPAGQAERHRAVCDDCPHQKLYENDLTGCRLTPAATPCEWRSLQTCPDHRWP